MVGAEDRIEDVSQEYHPQGKMLQDPVRYTVRTRSIAQFEAPYGVLDFLRVGQYRFAGRGLELRIQLHVNHLNHGRNDGAVTG
jgi:hypothetical protein